MPDSQSNVIQDGRLFVISGPSGVGKGTLLKVLFSELDHISPSVSATTRSPRPGEINGVHYHFLSREQFEKAIKENNFLEYAGYGTNLYGTPKVSVLEQIHSGIDVVLEIEVQGAETVRKLMPDAILIYIQAPSIVELEMRLKKRKTETDEIIAKRLAIALDEQKHISNYDYLITNNEVGEASRALISIVVAERHRIIK